MLEMRLLVGIGGQRDGMEMVYECFARHMASSSQWSSLADLQIIKSPFSARLMSMPASGLRRVAVGYTRPVPASSSVLAPCPLPVLVLVLLLYVPTPYI